MTDIGTGGLLMNWVAFVEKWTPRIIHYVAGIRGRPDLAEEVAQRALLWILTARHTSKVSFESKDKTPVTPSGELTLIVGPDSHPIRLSQDQNNLEGLCKQIHARNVGVTADIEGTKGRYNLRLSLLVMVVETLELRTEPNKPQSNILDAPNRIPNLSVYLVARSRLIDIYRRINKEIPLEEPRDEEDDKPGPQYADPGSADMPDFFRDKNIRRSFERLAMEDRILLWFHVIEEFTLEEIGALIGRPNPSTVRARIRRAVERLRLELKIPHELIIIAHTQLPQFRAAAAILVNGLIDGDSFKIYAVRDSGTDSAPLAAGIVPKDHEILGLALQQAFNCQPKRTAADFLTILGQVSAKECKTTVALFADGPLQVANAKHLLRRYGWHAKKLDGTEVHVYLPAGVSGDSYKGVIKGFGGWYIRKQIRAEE